MEIIVGLGRSSSARQVGVICRAKAPPVPVPLGACPRLVFSLAAQPCKLDLIARIIIRREWRRRNLITVNIDLLVPPKVNGIAARANKAKTLCLLRVSNRYPDKRRRPLYPRKRIVGVFDATEPAVYRLQSQPRLKIDVVSMAAGRGGFTLF